MKKIGHGFIYTSSSVYLKLDPGMCNASELKNHFVSNLKMSCNVTLQISYCEIFI